MEVGSLLCPNLSKCFSRVPAMAKPFFDSRAKIVWRTFQDSKSSRCQFSIIDISSVLRAKALPVVIPSHSLSNQRLWLLLSGFF